MGLFDFITSKGIKEGVLIEKRKNGFYAATIFLRITDNNVDRFRGLGEIEVLDGSSNLNYLFTKETRMCEAQLRLAREKEKPNPEELKVNKWENEIEALKKELETESKCQYIRITIEDSNKETAADNAQQIGQQFEQFWLKGNKMKNVRRMSWKQNM